MLSVSYLREMVYQDRYKIRKIFLNPSVSQKFFSNLFLESVSLQILHECIFIAVAYRYVSAVCHEDD